MDKFKHTLSSNHGVAHSRIWMEKDRLTNAGFTHGTTFRKTWTPATLVLEVATMKDGDKKSDFGTVAGTKDRPIIDIVGAKVVATFKGCTEVNVTYEAGRITVRKAS